ncbi:hypothetical protein LCGC14_0358580 [marine sediment metagenome]|uniref:Uncharacterized protein n=1 Tax=marine sediment metagenome TaxID=412755 RepID=A0A0F9WGS4_9ZZZZ
MDGLDSNWEAESDARSLAEADVIRGDSNRLTAAKKAAVEMARRQKEQADSIAKVAKGELSYPPPPRSV